MSLETRLADRTLELHPVRSAAVLERLPVEQVVPLLDAASPGRTAGVLRRLASRVALAVLAGLARERAAAALSVLEPGEAALLVRRLSESEREAILSAMSPPHTRALRSLLRFPEGTAGSLADPDALSLPEDLSAGEALDAVRAAPQQTRYNVYVVDRDQRLVGVLNLRELLMLEPDARLGGRMQRSPHRVRADADLATVVHHPGWLQVHALPVVDEDGAYVGVIRYKTLRALERRDADRREEAETSRALGELFATAAGGLLDALVGPAGGSREGADGR